MTTDLNSSGRTQIIEYTPRNNDLVTALKANGLGPDYMEGFQPGLSFSSVNRAELALRLHGNF